MECKGCWDFYKDLYRSKYIDIKNEMGELIKKKRVKITEDNVLDYYESKKGWFGSVKYNIKPEYYSISGYYCDKNSTQPFPNDDLFSCSTRYIISEKDYNHIECKYEMSVNSLIFEIKSKLTTIFNEDISSMDIKRFIGIEGRVLVLS